MKILLFQRLIFSLSSVNIVVIATIIINYYCYGDTVVDTVASESIDHSEEYHHHHHNDDRPLYFENDHHHHQQHNHHDGHYHHHDDASSYNGYTNYAPHHDHEHYVSLHRILQTKKK